MKVKDLIAELNKHDPNTDITFNLKVLEHLNESLDKSKNHEIKEIIVESKDDELIFNLI
jgi:hypothetical protein